MIAAVEAMGCGTSKSVETTITNEGPNKPNGQDANENVDSKPANSLDDNFIKPVEETELTESRDYVFSIGDRVHVSGYTGNVKFIGQLKDLGDGDWIGIELDRTHPQGNDGYFQGVQCFACKPRHGLFARASSVFPHADNDSIKEDFNISLQTITFIQTSMRRYLAKIRLKRFRSVQESRRKLTHMCYRLRKQKPGVWSDSAST